MFVSYEERFDPRKLVAPILAYLEDNYPEAEQGFYSKKAKVPTWRLNDTFISIHYVKSMINIHIGRKDVIRFLAYKIRNRPIRGVFSFKVEDPLPYEALYEAIDLLFAKNDNSVEEREDNA